MQAAGAPVSAVMAALVELSQAGRAELLDGGMAARP
jgi:DNA processing protein